MRELKYLGIFALALVACIISGISIFWALGSAIALFAFYGVKSGFSMKKLAKMSLSGIRQMSGLMLIFVFIGSLTAVWRQSGTIAYIVYYATSFCSPRIMLLMTFLLCAGMSMLTGTSFGTAATMGAICVTMAINMGVSPVWAGGAMLSGIYVGDRGSPVSSCALFVTNITGTDHYTNVKRMLRSSVVPFIITLAVFALGGLGMDSAQNENAARDIFRTSFVLHPTLLIPAVIVVVMSLLRLPIMLTMGTSIAAASVLTVVLQKVSVLELVKAFVFGFKPADTELAAVLGGGGILSMATVFFILIISGILSGIFRGTGFMVAISSVTEKVSDRITPFGTVIVVSILTVMISCNQALSTVLTQQLCAPVVLSKQQMADDLNNSVVTISGIIPWSIAGAMPLAMVGAPLKAMLLGCYLYLVPLCCLAQQLIKTRKERRNSEEGL